VRGKTFLSEIWTTPVTITVRKLKTRKANIARLEILGPPRRSPISRPPAKTGVDLLEPITSGDGRLLILNSGDNLIYSVMGQSATPCDAKNWTRLDHISRMHRDSAMKRYGIARYPFRDSENRTIKPGRPIRGAYPWLDREAKNLFFMQIGGLGLFYRDSENTLQTRFPVLNKPKKRSLSPNIGTRFGISYAGLWSQGKIVIPDTRANNVDFDVGKNKYQPSMRLYRDQPAGQLVSPGVTTRINAPQNQWNFRSAILPRSPRDVVWWVSANNDMTGEVVFDDVVDLGMLIYSPMNAAVDNKKRAFRDGFDYKKKRGYTEAPRLQNSAASQLLWETPSYGKLIGARVEPIAAGGKVGKGVWLDGSAGRIEYTIPDQRRGTTGSGMSSAVWTTTLWLDLRQTTDRQRLRSFPDGSWLDLAPGLFILGDAAGVETSVTVPESLAPGARRWTHLGVVSTPDSFTIYLQGFKLGSWSGTYLRPRPGMLTVGRPRGGTQSGFHGWIDELRVVSGRRDPETMCNYAHGTLRGLDAGLDSSAHLAAGTYPDESHEEIGLLLADYSGEAFSRYTCEQERTTPDACLSTIHLQHGPPSHCVRPGILFPEGPLFHDLPRPGSRANAFCLTCHTNGHPTDGLEIGRPLRSGGNKALTEDPRRQPSQTPPFIHGFLPKGVLGQPQNIRAPATGFPLDPVLYPSAHSILEAADSPREPGR
jgi:hypothetical protein